jgi:hypothetical protein
MQRSLSLFTAAFFGLVCFAVGADVTKDPARNKAVAWIRANNAFGPTHRIVADMSEVVDDALDDNDNLTLTFGSGLVKSGRATSLSLFGGDFFLFELSAAQAQRLGLEPKSTSAETYKRSGQRQEIVAKLDGLKFDGGTGLDGGQRITGHVDVQRLKATDEKFAVRITYRANGSTTMGFHYLEEPLPAAKGPVKFSFSAVNGKEDEKKFAGPMPVFVDLCTVKDNGGGDVEILVYSNTVASVLDVK